METPKQEKPQSELPKLKAFITIRKTFAMIGISPALVSPSRSLKNQIPIGLLLLCAAVIFLVVYILNDAETFSEYTQSIYIIVIGVLFTVTLFILIRKIGKFFELINSFDNILNMKLKYSSTRPTYNVTNLLEEKLFKLIFFVLVEMACVCTAVPLIVYTYYIYFTTDLGSQAFDLPFAMWFPFNWKNPVGFLVAISIQYTITAYGLTFCACVFGLAVGCFLYVIALNKIIKASLFNFSQNTRAKIDQIILLEQLIEFIELHSGAKQLVSNFSDVFQDIIVLVFGSSLIVISGAMLMIQIQLVHGGDNLMALLITIPQVIYAFAILFFDCEMGQRVNIAFAECSEMVDQLHWYLFPMKMQRMLPAILNFTQQPFVINCFGSTRCDRKTFKSVIKTAFSYFMVLRELYN